MLDKGCLIISFDCEGKWGFSDKINPYYDNILIDKNILSAYRKTLDLLKNNHIKATFAFVGAFTMTKEMFYEKENMFSRRMYANKNWLDIFYQQNKKNSNSEGWFCPEAYEYVTKYTEHEIASHGFTHLPFDEKLVSREDILHELHDILAWSTWQGIDISTFIFPRNKIGYTDLLSSIGIKAYRDTPQFYGIKPRLKAEALKYKPPYLAQEHSKKLEKIRIPGGNLLAFRKKIRLPPDFVIINRWKRMIDNAVSTNGVVHIWMHPHNLIDGIKQAHLFNSVLSYAYNKYIKKGNLLNLTQKEYMEAINAK